MTHNDTLTDSMFRHVTVTTPIKLPVLFAGSRDAPPSDREGFTPPGDDSGQNSSAIIIIVLSVVVLGAIFFTVCGLLVKSQALVVS